MSSLSRETLACSQKKKKRNFQTPLHLRKFKKKRVVFCTTKYLCSPDVSWRPPYPTRALQNQLQPLPTDSTIHKSQSPSLGLLLMLGDLQFSGPGCPLKFCHPRWIWRRAALTSPDSLWKYGLILQLKQIIKYLFKKRKEMWTQSQP